MTAYSVKPCRDCGAPRQVGQNTKMRCLSCFHAKYDGRVYARCPRFDDIARIEREAERQEEMMRLYRAGKTLQEIGELFNLSRERIRQILASAGVSSDDGGQALITRQNIPARLARRAEEMQRTKERRDKASMGKFGCDFHTAKNLNGNRPLNKKGTPAKQYSNQKKSAKTRGIAWEMTFPEWVRIWRDSGHYQRRGRGTMVMARKYDTGSYAVSNVYGSVYLTPQEE